MTDETSVTLSTRSQSFPYVYGEHRAELFVRCVENRTAVVIDWDEYLGRDTSYDEPETKALQVRLDNGKPETFHLSTSTDFKAMGWWSGSTAIPFIKRMQQAKTMVVRVTPYGQSEREATFDIANLSDNLSELSAACGWPNRLGEATPQDTPPSASVAPR